MKIKLLVWLLMLAPGCLLASTGPKTNYPLNGANFIINNNPNQVVHQAAAGGSTNWAAQVNNAHEFYSFANTLELYQYESTDLPVNFEYDLTISGTLQYQVIGSASFSTQQITLHINNKLQGSSRRMDYYSYANAYNSKFTLDSISLTGTPPPGTDLYTAVGKVVELNLSITQTHFLQPDFTLPVTIFGAPCLDSESNELVLTWPPVAYAEEYELEFVYVDDYDVNGSPLPPAALRYDFRNNATRVTVKSLYYRLPLVYDRGYLLFRLRPVGRGGPDWDKRIPGPWSAGNVNGAVDVFPIKTQITAAMSHTQSKLNWQLVTTYAENGKRKDLVQYDDGLFMTRQTVTGVSDARNVFTANINDPALNPQGCILPGLDKIKEIIAQENIYDFNGRVGVQIMPTPTGTHKIDYVPHLNQNAANVPYSWADFDKMVNCSLPAAALNTQGSGAFGAGEYYSPNNPNKIGYNAFIPDAQGFAFSRVQYTDDNTGRLSRQGGTGPQFQLDGTHETKFFYGTPNQVELDRMFGTEVGDAHRYLKKMVIDANGQTSVTYQNPEGKTIATALTGVVPGNLTMLDNEPRNPEPIEANLMADTVVDNMAHSLSVNKQLLVPATGQYKFKYSVKAQALNYITCAGASVCLDCIYDLTLSLRSNDGCTALPVFSYNGTFGDMINGTAIPNINKDCFNGTSGFNNRPIGFHAGDTTVTLTAGSYTLVKTLTVNKSAAEAYVNLIYADTCRAKFDDILRKENSKVDTTDCNQTCASCTTANPNNAAACAELCITPKNDCDMARQMMLADLKPGGQYAQFSVDANGKYYSTDPLSIFNPSSQLPANALLTTIFDFNITNVNDARNINNRIDNWNLTTAQEDTLLKSHPEYGQLQWCNIHRPAMDYSLKIKSANTLADAVAQGIVSHPANPGPADTYLKMLDNDPFFVHGSADYNDFKQFMADICATHENLMQMAMHTAYCTAPLLQSLSAATSATQTGPLSPPVTPATSTCALPATYFTNNAFGADPAKRDLEWTSLRDLYLSYREKYLYYSRLQYSLANHCFNGSIGTNNYHLTTLLGITQAHSPEGIFQVSTGDKPAGSTYALYSAKIKRFTCRYDAFNFTTAATPVNLTGINLYDNCPSAATVAIMQAQVATIANGYLCDTGTGKTPSDGKDNPDKVLRTGAAERPTADAKQPAQVCTALSPFANELFEFLVNLKKPKAPVTGIYQYARRRSALYAIFPEAAVLSYAYATDSKACNVQFSGQTTREQRGQTCTISFDSCDWMSADYTLISITPVFDGRNTQTNKFILNYVDAKGKQFKVTGDSKCLAVNQCTTPVLCADSVINLPPAKPYNACATAKYLMAHDNAEQIYTHWVDSMRADLLQKYYAKCMQAAERMSYGYSDDQYHYTLYYYDQAGNLTRTIPPAGVRLLTAAAAATVDAYRAANAGIKVPQHFFITNYQYNSLNQLTWQTTPDAGASTYYYDKLGRIAASQNAKQNPQNNYSYTWYDELGRNVESGELVNSNLIQANIDDYANWHTFIHAQATRRDITYSRYDESLNTTINNKFGTAGQQNLRGRIASIFSFADQAAQGTGSYRHATHYTYDVNGNVPMLIQDYPGTLLGDKVIAYDFDLISGKVNEMRYQPGRQDEFRHRYTYDDELRLTHVYTSTKGVIWQQDAEYFYYKHGPLARTELGELKVQGLDHIYTLQGWIKGVNGTDGTTTEDAGHDGTALENSVTGTATINGQQVATTVESNPNLNSSGPGYHSLHNTVAADAFGYVLNYYSGDYKPIENTLNTTSGLNAPIVGVKQLFNGNISQMYTNLQTLGGLGMNYTYDQLNRLKTQLAFTLSNGVATPTDAYEMDLNYDGNGNIINLYRHGRQGNIGMDKQVYHYYDANNVEIPSMVTPPVNATNRLASISDQENSAGYPETNPVNGTVKDVDNQSANNYTYDAIGNLIKDNAEGIQNINWNLQNKITNISKTSGALLFAYDARANRVSKRYVPATGPAVNTYYVRDASGTILGTYELKDNKLSWQEQELYGASRLGVWQPNQVITTSSQTLLDGYVDWQNIRPGTVAEDSLIRGSKIYELTNHLGNVLATITDRKLQAATAPNGTSGITADLVSTTDYYAFGMQMPGRGFNSGAYRFGFGGQEADNEIQGNGNAYTADFWEYDPRLGRRWNNDPMVYSWQSPYATFNNNPVVFADPTGLEPGGDKKGDTFVGDDGKTYTTSSDAAEVVGVKQQSMPTGTDVVKTAEEEPKGTKDKVDEYMEKVDKRSSVLGAAVAVAKETVKGEETLAKLEKIGQGADIVGYIVTVKDFKDNTKTPLGGKGPRANPIPYGVDLLTGVPGAGAAAKDMFENNLSNITNGEMDAQYMNQNYAVFKNFVNKQNGDLGPDNDNTIIMIYTNYQVDAPTLMGTPTWRPAYNKEYASQQFNMTARYVNWGYYKDFKKSGILVIKGTIKLE